MADIISQVSIDNLKTHIQSIEGLRHGQENYEALEKRALHIEKLFGSLGLTVRNQPVPFRNKVFRNIIADKTASSGNVGTILIGAHYDAAQGSPGSDDNASGVAVMLETARILTGLRLNNSLRFVAFTLEEPQPLHFLIGSRHFAETAKKAGEKYDAVIILESVGYASKEKGSQIVPSFVRMIAPDVGNFLGIVANRTSESIMKSFREAANEFVPQLPIASYKTPFSGYLMPETRLSDHSPFWDCGYPAVMLTDTAMFRNPYYHTEHDSSDKLDFAFMSDVTKSVISFALLRDRK